MAWGSYGRGKFAGPWPGRGPFAHLPPWQRPGWTLGRGACWWLYWNPNILRQQFPTTPYIPVNTPIAPEDELSTLEDYVKSLYEKAKGVEQRIEELKKLAERKP